MQEVDVRSPIDVNAWQRVKATHGKRPGKFSSVLIHFQAEDVLLELFLGLQTGPNPLSFVISPSIIVKKYRG